MVRFRLTSLQQALTKLVRVAGGIGNITSRSSAWHFFFLFLKKKREFCAKYQKAEKGDSMKIATFS